MYRGLYVLTVQSEDVDLTRLGHVSAVASQDRVLVSSYARTNDGHVRLGNHDVTVLRSLLLDSRQLDGILLGLLDGLMRDTSSLQVAVHDGRRSDLQVLDSAALAYVLVTVFFEGALPLVVHIHRLPTVLPRESVCRLVVSSAVVAALCQGGVVDRLRPFCHQLFSDHLDAVQILQI